VYARAESLILVYITDHINIPLFTVSSCAFPSSCVCSVVATAPPLSAMAAAFPDSDCDGLYLED